MSIWVSFLIASAVPAGACGAVFELSWFTVDGGGGMSTGGGFTLSGTIGQPDAGVMTGGGFTLSGGFWSGATTGTPSVPGDCDADGDVDLTDYSEFESCLGGPVAPSLPDCECFDFDVDSDVDLRDLAEFQVVFTD